MRWVIGLLLGVCVWLAAAAPTDAQQRIALVIGNAKYNGPAFGPLTNPANDARLMERTLKGLGFDVQILLDATEDQMEDAISDLGVRLAAAGDDAVGFFYFAGHGVLSQGRNYMIPADSRARTEQAVWTDAPRMGEVEEAMGAAGNRLNFIVFDACRTNGLPVAFRGPTNITSLRETRTEGVLIGYASRPGAPAADGSGGNSPYAAALARHLRTQGIIAEQVFKRVADDVRSATNNTQQPWIEGGLSGADFCFSGCGGSQPAAVPAPQPRAPAVAAPSADPVGEFDVRLLHPAVAGAVMAARDAERQAYAKAAEARQAAAQAEEWEKRAEDGAAGTVKWGNESQRLAGEVGQNATLDGFGVQRVFSGNLSGRSYRGTWVNSVQSGVGVQDYGDNENSRQSIYLRYEGEFTNGAVTGQGVIFERSGQIVAGKQDGSGSVGPTVYRDTDGGRFEGEYAGGKANGLGVLWSAEGTVRGAGRWVDGNLVEAMAP